ncbi:unnamed protein product [Closterium sp. Naga37s-1]|nr:unnamed protein product [Closterium sp. Naga37s-1]
MFFAPHPPSLPSDYVLCSSPALSPHCHGAPPVMEQLLRLVNSLTSPLSSPPLSPHFPSLPTSSHRAPPGDGAAVMEQLFGLVNSLLQAHEGATRRHLAIRTYKVVPFTPSAGLLEWVDGTLPLGEYLLGSTRKGGAHARYGGSDWPFMTCREVGYVVGLGDRHAMNILLDERSAEVVHIDLGIAFEQGLMLKTPEKLGAVRHVPCVLRGRGGVQRAGGAHSGGHRLRGRH